MRGINSAHTPITGRQTASTSPNQKIFEATLLGQSKPDQPLGCNTQMPALNNQRFVIFRGADEQFDEFASQQQRLQADRPGYGVGEITHELKRGSQVDHWQAWAPNAGLDILGLGISDIVKHKLSEFIDRHAFNSRRNFTGQRLFEKPDRHAPGDQAIAYPAFQGAQKAIVLILMQIPTKSPADSEMMSPGDTR